MSEPACDTGNGPQNAMCITYQCKRTTMSTTPATYDEVLSRAQQLAPADQLRLAEELIALARQQIAAPPQQHSILELEGLGKEIWQGINVEDYINEERDSWDG
jgi:hypothetical protein